MFRHVSTAVLRLDADRLGHGDHGGPDIGYNKAADEKSWADMQAFFKKIFS
jgi:dienelactone hydrolase